MSQTNSPPPDPDDLVEVQLPEAVVEVARERAAARGIPVTCSPSPPRFVPGHWYWNYGCPKFRREHPEKLIRRFAPLWALIAPSRTEAWDRLLDRLGVEPLQRVRPYRRNTLRRLRRRYRVFPVTLTVLVAG